MVKGGKLKYAETIMKVSIKLPDAFFGLSGNNQGKMLVKTE